MVLGVYRQSKKSAQRHSLLTVSTLHYSMTTGADTLTVWRVPYILYLSIVVGVELHVCGTRRDELMMKSHETMTLHYNS